MKASIIKIGNSRGIRIPKVLLDESGLGTEVDLRRKGNTIIISPVIPTKTVRLNEEYLFSLPALAKEWDTPEEDTAWTHLQ